MNPLFGPRTRLAAVSPRAPHPRRSLGAALLLALLGAALPAHATQYWTAGAVLTSFFKGATKISYKAVSLSDAEAAEIGKRLGTGAIKKDWSIYFSETAGKRNEGFAILDKELGLHEPIDFAVRFTGAGAVDSIEVME